MPRKGLLILFFPWSCLWDLVPLTSGYLSMPGRGVSSSAVVSTVSDLSHALKPPIPFKEAAKISASILIGRLF